ncbi:Planctomycete cytochrome C [Bremerella volcania]|uniref:Planctomycete cytochrome C n=1 Tax=Bremerella volcania TaxID=2527984 RepID=A0A518C9B5_9BACT|nr:PSD1 and planctomycete cytochrome C domain-containing protein [Bremerella volcania]QDU75817.1 Planctomycete cytochrome C [Bremerella volcania]
MRLLLAAFVLQLFSLPVQADESFYEEQIKPLLAMKCFACHGALKQESDLRLDAGQLIHSGGATGPVIDLEKPTESLLLSRIQTADLDLRMPPDGEGEPLTPGQVDLLTTWIRGGAKFPKTEEIPPDPRQHWAYQVPRKVELPRVKNELGELHPVDAFLLANLQDHQLSAAPHTDRSTLVRRVYLDLIGLPPTADQQRAFLDDPSPDAWKKLVDELLDDPAYGERWGRHWMDVWRYSDWDGYKNELRGSQRHIWRWRDWIVESVNADKPYDRMIREMLAADEIAPTDQNVLRATGYLARNYHKSNRNIWLDATVEHTAKAFLGMTIDCARCHDHKFDPIGQSEYYAMRAVFEPHEVRTERLPGEADLVKQGLVRAYDAKPDEPTYVYIAGNEKHPDKEHPVEPGVPEVIELPYEPHPIDLPPLAVYPSLKEFIEQEQLESAAAKVKASEMKIAETTDPADKSVHQQDLVAATAEYESLKARWAADRAKYAEDADSVKLQQLAKRAAMAENTAKLERARHTVLLKEQSLSQAESSPQTDEKQKAAVEKSRKEVNEAMKKREEAERLVNSLDAIEYSSIGTAYPPKSTGRRSALASWITDRRNPLTARVAVNHIWMRHFGEPLVENVFDFGLRSPKPEHVDLLDWLAVEFMESDWSMKHLHRLILTSAAYRRASSVSGEEFMANRAQDPDNRLLWRSNIQRLDAESIRDSVLHVAGRLDRTLGGPDIDFDQGEKVYRRSLYFRHAYEKQMQMLVTFDAAAPNECYRRSQSVIPQQALALSNSSLVVEQSRRLAARLSGEVPEAEGFIRAAFESILCRDCTVEELAACQEFLVSQTERLSYSGELTPIASGAKAGVPAADDSAQRARENLVHVLFNHNDFVTVR